MQFLKKRKSLKMKKNIKKIFKFLILVFSCTSSAYAGMINSGKYVAKESQTWGDLINETTGTILGEQSTFLSLVNYGSANFDRCIIKGKIISYGSLVANETQFLLDLTVMNGGEATLTSCKIENLIISNYFNEKSVTPPLIILNGSTVIRGSIEFKGDSGIIYKGANVKILGTVINGTIKDLGEFSVSQEF